MDVFDAILKCIVGVGIPAIICAGVYIGRKLQVLDDLKLQSADSSSFCKSATNAIVEMQTHLAGKGFCINQKLAYTNNSPLKLTEWGEKIMWDSGFASEILNPEKRDYLIKLVKAKDPKTNYDIQQNSIDVMNELAEVNDPIAVPIKEYAYKEGITLEILLNSAGIMLRDQVMQELKFEDKI
jgi:hypothetical protein